MLAIVAPISPGENPPSVSILQKPVAQVVRPTKISAAMKRTVINAGLIGAFTFALALLVSPQLHERIHSDATQSQHECVVTMVASGNFHHASPPPITIAPAVLNQFSSLPALSPIWVPSPFQRARIFEHAPPQ